MSAQHLSGWDSFEEIVHFGDGGISLHACGHDRQQQIERARLIASAPELLAMVVRLLDIAENVLFCEGHYVEDADVSDAKALIAKATGSTS